MEVGSVDFSEWEPVYAAIVEDLDLDRGADRRARDRLADLTIPFDLGRLAFAGETVAIVGGGPIEDLTPVQHADRVVAAGGGIEHCWRTDVPIDLVVTDLDSAPEVSVELTHTGTPVAVAAHGDNVPAIETHVPSMDRDSVLATTQAKPVAHVVNAGGFTDGDRAAFIADHCGGESLAFLGWDLDDSGVGPMKRRKLRWAERLLSLLEQRRHDRFPVLDGRREEIDTDEFV